MTPPPISMGTGFLYSSKVSSTLSPWSFILNLSIFCLLLIGISSSATASELQMQLWNGNTLIRQGECTAATADKWCDELASRHHLKRDAEATSCLDETEIEDRCKNSFKPWFYNPLRCFNGWYSCYSPDGPKLGNWGVSCPDGLKWNDSRYNPTCICENGNTPTKVDGKFVCCPPAGEAGTFAFTEVDHDTCKNSCELTNLSPTVTGKWVESLQGEYTGRTCTDKPYSELEIQKTHACGTAGTGGYSTKTTHPIDFSTGNKYFHATDYRGSGSFPIVFDRSYNSLNLGWRYTYTQRIEQLADDLMVVRRPGGQSYEFSLSGGQWLPDPDVTDRLEAQTAADGTLTGWHYTSSGNRQERFDAEGRLTSIRNAAGLEQTLTHSADGSQIIITDPQGDTLLVTLNVNGLFATSIEDNQGRSTLFQYDGSYLTQVIYPNGTSKQYLYEVPERPWLITGIIDENGNRSNTVEYDAQGRAIMSELANGVERVEVSYNDDGTTTLTNALGKKTRFQFETLHGVRKIVHVEGEPTQTCQGSAMDYRFDDNGFLIEKTDAKGIVTQYTRDEHGLELSKTEAVGLPEARTVTTQWDSERRLPLVVTEANRETHYVYDTPGRTLERTVTDSSSGASRTTRYSYNPQGLLESVDGPREDVADISHYDYDAQGKLARVINALGHVTTIVNRDPSGRPITTRDANGLESQLVYNDSGKLIERRIGSETTAMSYDAVGNLLSVTTATGDTLTYRYDAANRLIGIEDVTGNRITYTLDAMNNRTSEEVFDNSNQLISTQQKVYDELSRLLKSVGANGQDTTYGYDRNNNLTSTIDPLWRVHESAYDGLNRLIEQTDPATGVTSYGYDSQGQLSAVTDPNGNSTSYVYDGLGNLLEQHSPDTGTISFSHDAAGNVISKTDNSANVTRYQYDALNRLLSESHADGNDSHYSYDTAENGIGRLAGLSDSSGEIELSYDAHGRTTQRRQTITIDGISHSHTTAWQYSSAGQLTGMTYPSGMQLGYQYRDGKISALTINGEPLLSAISYRPFGPITAWQWATGSQHQRAYNQDGQLTAQSLGNTERQLDYDAVGNITTINEAANQQVFTYDELNRLLSANDATINLAWAYDANGNRIGETDHDITTPYSIDATSNKLLTQGTTAYQYDSNGHLINDGEHSYQYNTRQRLTQVDEGQTAYYRYNALGQRVYKKGIANPCDVNSDGSVTHADLKLVTGKDKSTIEADGPGKGEAKGKGQSIACIASQMNNGNGQQKESQSGSRQIFFVYDEHRLLGEYDMAGNPIQETVWLGNLPVATVQNGNTYAIHTDHLGTPRVITDKKNIEVWKWESDPFGVAAANDDPDGDGVKLTYNLRFPGQYYDAETGKHYNYLRDYDPGTGRYFQSDPIGLMGGLNTYAYAEGNPLSMFDPSGLSSCGFDKERCKEIALESFQECIAGETGYCAALGLRCVAVRKSPALFAACMVASGTSCGAPCLNSYESDVSLCNWEIGTLEYNEERFGNGKN